MKGSIGSRIRRLREKREWSQIVLEEKTGINNSVLSRIESDKRPVQADELKKFAEVFDVSADYLLGRTDDPKLILSQEEREAIDKENLDKLTEEILEELRRTPQKEKEEILDFIRFKKQQRSQ